MSGIFGIVNFDGRPVRQAELKFMSSKMVHRGPDGCNIWLKNDVGLGLLMLCSTPESLNEPLPWEDPQSGLIITADARIDNRDELITTLSIDSGIAPPIPDSQIIVAAFRKWGKSCVDHLLGDFSFVIWDQKKRQLFVARDHMGIRPFYYYSSGALFVFASSASAIAQVSRVSKQVNEARVADFLIDELEGINNTATFFNNIYRMPPAHFGLVEQNKISFHRYWEPDSDRCLQLASDDDYADALEEVLTLAIKARVRSQYPASSMLSGGVDSSTIVGISRKLHHENGSGPFRTYSAISDNSSNCIESHFIRLMIEQGELDPILVSPSVIKDYTSDFDRTNNVLEDPFDECWTMLRLIYLTARKHGSVVVMDGGDGDLITGITTGYPSYLLRQGEIIPALHEINAQRVKDYEGQIGWIKACSQAIRPALTPNWLRKLKASYWPSDLNKDYLKDAMLSDAFAKKVKLEDRWKEYRGQSTFGFCSSLRQAHAERIIVPYLTAGIERYNRIASYCGVEARQPFLDRRVVELCLSLPWQQKVQHGWMKYGLRNVLQRVAPAEVAWRSEFDSIMWKFAVAWNENNRQKNLSIISKNREQLLNVVDKKQLDQMLIKYTNNDADAMHPIWNIVTLLNWLKRNQLEI